MHLSLGGGLLRGVETPFLVSVGATPNVLDSKFVVGVGSAFSSCCSFYVRAFMYIYHIVVLLSTSPPSPAQESSAPSIMPSRKAKHKDRKRKTTTKKVSRGNGGQILTEQELAQHVSAQYITGRGGVLRESHAKAKRREDSTRLKEIDPDFNQHLRNLDRHPALVLNANYQVRDTKRWFRCTYVLVGRSPVLG